MDVGGNGGGGGKFPSDNLGEAKRRGNACHHIANKLGAAEI